MPMTEIIADVQGIVRVMLKAKDVPLAAERAMKRWINEDVMPDFKATVETWDHTVKFESKVEGSQTRVVGEVWTTDKVYGILDAGSPKHDIPLGAKGFLAFQTSFTPKTKPKWVGSQAGGKSGPWARLYHGIKDHPGHKAREFAKTIADQDIPKLPPKFIEEYRKL